MIYGAGVAASSYVAGAAGYVATAAGSGYAGAQAAYIYAENFAMLHPAAIAYSAEMGYNFIGGRGLLPNTWPGLQGWYLCQWLNVISNRNIDFSY
jgi:hypothetical protein